MGNFRKFQKLPLLGIFILQLCLCLDPRAKPTYRMGFGSSFGHSGASLPGSSDIFLSLKNLNPDFFVWLGDFAYIDKSSYSQGLQQKHLGGIIERFEESYNDESKF